MNVDTRELMRLRGALTGEREEGTNARDELRKREMELERLKARGFVELTEDEAREADEILGEKESLILPEGHPLLQKVRNRTGYKAKNRRKIAKSSRKRNR